MFVDASVFVAIIKPEDDGSALAERLEQARNPISSPIAVVEAVMSLGRQKRIPADIAYAAVSDLLERAAIEIAPIDGETGALAVDAHARFGKGSGHPARLNLGDCFAYALAVTSGEPLLYKGGDFTMTDVARA